MTYPFIPLQLNVKFTVAQLLHDILSHTNAPHNPIPRKSAMPSKLEQLIVTSSSPCVPRFSSHISHPNPRKLTVLNNAEASFSECPFGNILVGRVSTSVPVSGPRRKRSSKECLLVCYQTSYFSFSSLDENHETKEGKSACQSTLDIHSWVPPEPSTAPSLLPCPSLLRKGKRSGKAREGERVDGILSTYKLYALNEIYGDAGARPLSVLAHFFTSLTYPPWCVFPSYPPIARSPLQNFHCGFATIVEPNLLDFSSSFVISFFHSSSSCLRPCGGTFSYSLPSTDIRVYRRGV